MYSSNLASSIKMPESVCFLTLRVNLDFYYYFVLSAKLSKIPTFKDALDPYATKYEMRQAHETPCRAMIGTHHLKKRTSADDESMQFRSQLASALRS